MTTARGLGWAAGAGPRLLRDEATVPAIRQAVRWLLDDPDYRRAAERIQAEIRIMPSAPQAIKRIEAFLATWPPTQ